MLEKHTTHYVHALKRTTFLHPLHLCNYKPALWSCDLDFVMIWIPSLISLWYFVAWGEGVAAYESNIVSLLKIWLSFDMLVANPKCLVWLITLSTPLDKDTYYEISIYIEIDFWPTSITGICGTQNCPMIPVSDGLIDLLPSWGSKHKWRMSSSL